MKCRPVAAFAGLVHRPEAARALSTTVTFDAAISGVFTTQADLDGSNATHSASGNNHGTSRRPTPS